MATRRIDLNCDLGEAFGTWRAGDDDAVMPGITSASIACGFHAGDPSVIRRTLRLAKAHGVAVGAHPGFPDLVGFGRRELRASPDEVEADVLYQVSAVSGMAAAEGLRLQHVKPHGALYNMAAADPALARAVARAVAAFDRALILFALAGSELVRAGRTEGLRVASEAFADRAYEPDGTLASRRQAGAVVDDPDLVVDRALRMVREGVVTALDGSTFELEIDTLCTHGDTPGAADLTRRIREPLEAAGVRMALVGVP